MLAILWIFVIGFVLLTLLARTIRWANESPEKWSISMQTPHPVAVNYPLLYRQPHGFYYVFRTKAFGNMFFRRVGDSCEVKMAGADAAA